MAEFTKSIRWKSSRRLETHIRELAVLRGVEVNIHEQKIGGMFAIHKFFGIAFISSDIQSKLDTLWEDIRFMVESY